MTVAGGIYVAYDRNGVDYEYACHPNNAPSECKGEQRRIVSAMSRRAKRNGGQVRLLSVEEYQETVVKKWEAHA